MNQVSSRPPADDPRQSPIYWVVLLLRARERGDVEGALQAQQELSRLGIHIDFRRSQETPRVS